MTDDTHLIYEAYTDKLPKPSYSAKEYADEMELKGIGQSIKGEDSENGICIEDLAKKHGVSLEEIQHELEMGIKVETEHTEDFDIATKIALDHLNEDPHYYTKLAQMENKPEDEEEGDLMTLMKLKGMIPKNAEVTTSPTSTHESFKTFFEKKEKRRLDPKCWKGYHKAGTKKKGDTRVNNCVKN